MAQGLVLIVEDDEWVARLLASALASAGFEALCVSSAEAGLDLAHAHPPACIVCDLELADHDGAWLGVAVRKLGGYAGAAPLLFLSSRDDEDARLSAHRAGGDAFMTKPFRIDEVVAQVGALVAFCARLRCRPEGQPAAFVDEPELHGNLAGLSVAGALGLLELERRTGSFEVLSRKRRAGLRLHDGRPVGGSLGGVDAPVLDVLRELLGWTTGRFAFRVTDVVAPASPPRALGHLVLEAARLEDRARQEAELGARAPTLAGPTVGGPPTCPEDYAPPSTRGPSRGGRSPAPMAAAPARTGLHLGPRGGAPRSTRRRTPG